VKGGRYQRYREKGRVGSEKVFPKKARGKTRGAGYFYRFWVTGVQRWAERAS